MADGEVAPLVARLARALQALDADDEALQRACQSAQESLAGLSGIGAGDLDDDLLSHWDRTTQALELYLQGTRSLLETLESVRGDAEAAAALAQAEQRPASARSCALALTVAQRVTETLEPAATHVAAVTAAVEGAQAELAEGQAAAEAAYAHGDRVAGDLDGTASPATLASRYLTTAGGHLAEAESWQQPAHLLVTSAEEDLSELIRKLEAMLTSPGTGGGSGSGARPGGAGGSGARDASEAAAKRRQAAAGREPAVSADINAVASATGGKRAGEEFVLKSEASLARKIQGKVARERLSPREAAAQIKDVLRYTITYPIETYMSQVDIALSDLRRRGYSIEQVKDTWQQNSPYKGINVILSTPDGERFEVQFHTLESFAVKMDNHSDYELWRTSTDEAQMRAATARMVAKSANLVHPPGAGAAHGKR